MKYYNIHTHIQNEEQNVISIVNFNIREFGSFCGLNLAREFYSIGIHPWKIKEKSLSKSIDYVEKNAIYNSVKAIGECGFDKICQTPWFLQEKAFSAQVLISENLKKPLIIHCVKAFDELIAVKKIMKPQQAWIIHGFRGKPQQADQLINQGFFFSIGFEFNEESLRIIPSDRLFFETDDRNINICDVYRKAAQACGIEMQDLSSRIKMNVKKQFFFDS
jgi:TatD DNase family protein